MVGMAGLTPMASALAAQPGELERAVDRPLLPDKPSVGTPLHQWFGATQCDINENVA